MAHIIVFPDHKSFDRATEVLAAVKTPFDQIDTPAFCADIVAPGVRVTGPVQEISRELRSQGITICGVLPYRPFLRDIPAGGPADPQWKTICGELYLSAVKPSLTDPLKLRLEVTTEKSLTSIIPIMARLIRGGAYRYEVPILVFEEEHRLLAVSSNEIVISRADDLLDGWIMLRCMIQLLLSAWDHRQRLHPETEPRNGIGAIEMFKRLPGTNCGKCPYGNCMEFAMMLFRGKCRMEQCSRLLQDEGKARLESLRWLLRAVGLAPAERNAGFNAARAPEHDRQPCAPGEPPEAPGPSPRK